MVAVAYLGWTAYGADGHSTTASCSSLYDMLINPNIQPFPHGRFTRIFTHTPPRPASRPVA